MPVVWIPPLMRELTGGAEKVTVAGASVRQVVNNLERMYPGMKERLCDAEGIRPHVAVVVDGEVSRLGLLQQVKETSEVHFLPSIAGGAGKTDGAPPRVPHRLGPSK